MKNIFLFILIFLLFSVFGYSYDNDKILDFIFNTSDELQRIRESFVHYLIYIDIISNEDLNIIELEIKNNLNSLLSNINENSAIIENNIFIKRIFYIINYEIIIEHIKYKYINPEYLVFTTKKMDSR
jgi:hypothetical protein